jgi:hypothetical protein
MELGRPVVPSLIVDRRVTPVMHRTQIATALGLSVPKTEESQRLAWDIVPVLDAWIAHLQHVEWDLLVRPTPSRGRTLRNLTVNVFDPVSLLPDAFLAGRFEWKPEEDDRREQGLRSTADVVEFARDAADAWMVFLGDHGEDLDRRNPPVASSRGDVTFGALLEYQRWHAAFHYRQVVEFLRGEGVVLPAVFEVEALTDLELPASVF